MIKIKVSYSTEIELAGVVRLLSPVLKSCKVQPQKGRYKRAYIDIADSAFSADFVKESYIKSQEISGK